MAVVKGKIVVSHYMLCQEKKEDATQTQLPLLTFISYQPNVMHCRPHNVVTEHTQSLDPIIKNIYF